MENYFDPDDPFEPDLTYNECFINWNLVNILVQTITEVKESGIIERQLSEHQDVFESRLTKTYMPPGFKEHVAQAVAKIISCAIHMHDIHPELQPFFAANGNLDGQGNNVRIVGGQVVHDMLTFGCGGGIVESENNTIENPSKWTHKKAQGKGIRPYFVKICPLQVVGIRTNKNTVTQLRVKTSVFVPHGKFNEKEKKQITVYQVEKEGVRYYKYEKDKKDKSILINDPKNNFLKKGTVYGENFSHIPLVLAYPSFDSKKQAFRASPPLIKLAEKTKQLLNMQSRQTSAVAQIQMPLIIHLTSLRNDEDINGFNNPRGDIFTANHTVIDMDKGERNIPPDDLRFVDTNSLATGIEAGQKLIDKIVNEIEILGYSLIYGDKPHISVTTATQRLLDQKETDSLIQSVLISYEDFLNNLLVEFGEWIGIPEKDVGRIEISKDVSGVIENSFKSVESLKQLENMLNNGVISKKTYLTELVERDTFITMKTSEDVDIELALVAHEEFS